MLVIDLDECLMQMNLFGWSQETFYINTLYFMIIFLTCISSLSGPFCVFFLSFQHFFLDWISRSIWKQCGVQLSAVYGEVKTLAESLVCDPQTRPSCAVHVRCPPGINCVCLKGQRSQGSEEGEWALNSKFSHHTSIEQECSDGFTVLLN